MELFQRKEMKLNKYAGNTIIQHQRPQVTNPLEDIQIDFYFMATCFAQSKTEISMKLWSVIIDSDGYVYAMKTRHLGHFEDWKEVIVNRLKDHIHKIGVDPLIVKRIIKDIDINKEKHIIPWDYRCTGTKIGIDGSDKIYIREDKFKI